MSAQYVVAIWTRRPTASDAPIYEGTPETLCTRASVLPPGGPPHAPGPMTDKEKCQIKCPMTFPCYEEQAGGADSKKRGVCHPLKLGKSKCPRNTHYCFDDHDSAAQFPSMVPVSATSSRRFCRGDYSHMVSEHLLMPCAEPRVAALPGVSFYDIAHLNTIPDDVVQFQMSTRFLNEVLASFYHVGFPHTLDYAGSLGNVLTMQYLDERLGQMTHGFVGLKFSAGTGIPVPPSKVAIGFSPELRAPPKLTIGDDDTLHLQLSARVEAYFYPVMRYQPTRANRCRQKAGYTQFVRFQHPGEYPWAWVSLESGHLFIQPLEGDQTQLVKTIDGHISLADTPPCNYVIGDATTGIALCPPDAESESWRDALFSDHVQCTASTNLAFRAGLNVVAQARLELRRSRYLCLKFNENGINHINEFNFKMGQSMEGFESLQSAVKLAEKLGGKEKATRLIVRLLRMAGALQPILLVDLRFLAGVELSDASVRLDPASQSIDFDGKFSVPTQELLEQRELTREQELSSTVNPCA